MKETATDIALKKVAVRALPREELVRELQQNYHEIDWRKPALPASEDKTETADDKVKRETRQLYANRIAAILGELHSRLLDEFNGVWVPFEIDTEPTSTEASPE